MERLIDAVIVVGGGQEPGLELDCGEGYAVIEHGAEEGAVADGAAAAMATIFLC